jgi:hypothetical protein
MAVTPATGIPGENIDTFSVKIKKAEADVTVNPPLYAF